MNSLDAYRKRLKRLIRHILLPWMDPYIAACLSNPIGWGLAILHYIAEFPLLVLDCLGMPEFFGFIQARFKAEARPLHARELQAASPVFEGLVSLQKIRIDETSRVGTHNGKYAYVSYYCVNSLGRLSIPVLMHEIVHVLQFEQAGSAYLFRNLMAHLSKAKYNYGGIERLKQLLNKPWEVHRLNYEQRADIVSDYYLVQEGLRPEWGSATREDLPIYKEVILKLFGKAG